MKDDLNCNVNGRQHQIVIYWEMEDDLNIKEMEYDLNFKEIKEDLIFLVHGRYPQCLFKLKTTSVSFQVLLAQLTLASSELGSAQPQLVSNIAVW